MEEQLRSLTMVNEGVTNGDAPAAYAATKNQPAGLASASAAPSACAGLPPVSHDAPVNPITQPELADQNQVSSDHAQAQQLDHDQQKQELQAFWSCQLAEIEQTTEFKNHNLPLSKIKKIMKADEDVKRIAGEVPVVFAQACEMFIQKMRGWHHTQEDERRTLQKNDITAALARTEVFDFLVPLDEQKGISVGPPKTTALQDDDQDPYANYYWECDCFSCPSSPDEPDYGNMSHDDPRYKAALFDYYSQL
jgi:nuclear transcription factor Y, gamma